MVLACEPTIISNNNTKKKVIVNVDSFDVVVDLVDNET